MTHPLIEAHLRRCQAANLSPVTIIDRGELLRRLHQELPLGLVEATTEDLEDWLVGPIPPARPWSPETRSNYYKHVAAFFRDMGDRTGHDPTVGLVRPRVERHLPHPATEEEVAAALARLRRPWDLYIMLAAHAGLRRAEIAGLLREDATEERILVRSGKGGKRRTVETHPELWRRIRLVRPGPIAMLGSGLVMTASQMGERARYQLIKAGLAPLTLHSFRHRFATMLLRPRELGGAGADLLTVSVLMGHTNPNTTRIYTLITSEQRRLAIHALPALAPSAC